MKKDFTNVLFAWEMESNLKSHFRNAFKKFKNIRLIFPGKFTEENILQLSKDAHIIIGWRINKKVFQSAKNLKVFINPGTGVKHHINIFRELNKTGDVILINNHGHAYSTAQHTVSMLLSLMNKIIFHHEQMTEGKWRTSDDKDIFSSSVRFKNRKIGLLGYGAINKFVHRFLSGFENEFHILKNSWRKDDIKSAGAACRYTGSELNNFLKAIDILIIAVPHTDKTQDMIGENELKLLGKNGIVVNVARGIIVNEKSLYFALKNKIISGAAIDVWYNYSPEKDKNGREYPYKYPFHKLKNILMSPHRAASPFDDIERWDGIIENVKRVSQGRNDLLDIVNIEKEY